MAAAWTASGEAGQRGTVRNSSTQTPTYLDISREAGLTFTNVNGASPQKRLVETMGSGGLFFDFDNDGWIDIFLVDGGSEADAAVARTARHRLFRNRRNGTFDDVTSASGIRHREYGMGACAGDYDNDGLVDLYITNVGPNVLYRNSGGGVFTDVTQKAGVASALWGTSCAFADFDKDGRLDLFVTNYVEMGKDRDRFCGNNRPMLRQYCHPLVFQSSPNVVYRNAGNGSFTDVTTRAAIAGYRGNGLGVAVADYDDDSWPDVFVANDGVPNFLFHNDGRGGFTDNALVAGVSSASDGRSRAGMGTAFGDVDGDGRLDLVVTNHETEMHSLFKNRGAGSFADATVESGVGPATLPYVGFGVVLADYDNDGDLDLAIVNGHVIDSIALVRNGAKHAEARSIGWTSDGRAAERRRFRGAAGTPRFRHFCRHTFIFLARGNAVAARRASSASRSLPRGFLSRQPTPASNISAVFLWSSASRRRRSRAVAGSRQKAIGFLQARKAKVYVAMVSVRSANAPLGARNSARRLPEFTGSTTTSSS